MNKKIEFLPIELLYDNYYFFNVIPAYAYYDTAFKYYMPITGKWYM